MNRTRPPHLPPARTSLWRETLLACYLAASWPYRRAANAWAARRGQAAITVLFYHRVCDEHPNAWTISNGRFTRQIRWLQRHCELISLSEAQRRLREGCSYAPAACITFDDGYADNLDAALPLLIKERIPCTYFVTLRPILEGVPFDHDVAAGRPLPPNTLEQIRALSHAGVEIGAHTRTHPDLGRIQDQRQLQDEVVAATAELAELLHKPVRYFAFPFGLPANVNPRVLPLAREAGLCGVCAAAGGYNEAGQDEAGQDTFLLQRTHADPSWIRFLNALTIDPRKRRRPRAWCFPQPGEIPAAAETAAALSPAPVAAGRPPSG